jgi:hypothetical protein
MDCVIAGLAGLSMIIWASGLADALLSPVKRTVWAKRSGPRVRTTIRMREMETINGYDDFKRHHRRRG